MWLDSEKLNKSSVIKEKCMFLDSLTATIQYRINAGSDPINPYHYSQDSTFYMANSGGQHITVSDFSLAHKFFGTDSRFGTDVFDGVTHTQFVSAVTSVIGQLVISGQPSSIANILSFMAANPNNAAVNILSAAKFDAGDIKLPAGAPGEGVTTQPELLIGDVTSGQMSVSDFVDWTYVYGSSAFHLEDSALVTLDGSGNLVLNGVLVSPGPVTNNENFDFNSSGLLAKIFNTAWENEIDPVGQGGGFDIIYDNSHVATNTIGQYDQANFNSDTLANRDQLAVAKTSAYNYYRDVVSDPFIAEAQLLALSPNPATRALATALITLMEFLKLPAFGDQAHQFRSQLITTALVRTELGNDLLTPLPLSDLIYSAAYHFAADQFCFAAGTPIDMWPLASSLKPGPDGTYDQAAVRAGVWTKPIEDVTDTDTVISFNKQGKLVPGTVTRTMTNNAKIILDFHGTFVTPGHVYWCAGGKFEGKYAPLIDILRDDGVIQHQDGTLIRASTGCEVGAPDDEEFHVFKLYTDEHGNERVRDQTKLRYGTRWMKENGQHFTMRQYIEGIGVEILQDGPQRGYARWKDTGITSIFAWVLSDTLPKPEDFILARSATSLEDIYKAGQWEYLQPSMPAPMVMDGGPVQPLPERRLDMMPRNEPVAFSSAAPSSQMLPERQPQMNRRQRKAAEAKARRAAKNKRPKGATLH